MEALTWAGVAGLLLAIGALAKNYYDNKRLEGLLPYEQRKSNSVTAKTYMEIADKANSRLDLLEERLKIVKMQIDILEGEIRRLNKLNSALEELVTRLKKQVYGLGGKPVQLEKEE